MKKIILTICFLTSFFSYNIISLKAQYIVKPGDSSDNYNIVNINQYSSFSFPSSNTTLQFPIIGCANDSIFTCSTTGYSEHYTLNDLYHYTTLINIIDTSYEIGIDTSINNVHYSTIIPYLNLPNSYFIDSNTSNHWVKSGTVQLYFFHTLGISNISSEFYLPIRKKIGNSYFYGWIFYKRGVLGGNFSFSINNFSEFKKIKILKDSISCNTAYTFANGVTLNNLYHDTTYNFNIPSSNIGCDSLVKTELKVNLLGLVNNYDTICIGTNYTFIDGSNFTINQNSIFVHQNVYTAQNGCDSIIETILKVKGSYDTILINKYCGSSYLFPDNSFVSQIFNDTIQTSHFINFEGCDSSITTKINIVTIQGPYQHIYVCKGSNYTFPDGMTVSNITSGLNHVSYFTTSNGCDSSVYISLDLWPFYNNFVTQFGTQLFANANVAISTYQWLKCNPSTIISGANNQTYTATTNGDYAVIVTQNGCSDTSICMTVNGVGINELNTQNIITISPNPTNSIFKIECPMNSASVILYNSFGQKLLTSKIENNISLIDISQFSKGIYIAEIIDDKISYRVKIIKD